MNPDNIEGPRESDTPIVEAVAFTRFESWASMPSQSTRREWSTATHAGRDHFYATGSIEPYMAEEHAFIAAHPGIETP